MQVLLESHTELHIIVAWQGKLRGLWRLIWHIWPYDKVIDMLRCRTRLETITFSQSRVASRNSFCDFDSCLMCLGRLCDTERHLVPHELVHLQHVSTSLGASQPWVLCSSIKSAAISPLKPRSRTALAKPGRFWKCARAARVAVPCSRLVRVPSSRRWNPRHRLGSLESLEFHGASLQILKAPYAQLSFHFHLFSWLDHDDPQCIGYCT